RDLVLAIALDGLRKRGLGVGVSRCRDLVLAIALDGLRKRGLGVGDFPLPRSGSRVLGYAAASSSFATSVSTS
ncbi:hypothetical protein, partial [Microbacterium sp. 1.5R]|uniref:hypothetical protein n=1 Tax=Microbacterium sp. 1.5R TaxID=1916917 RepID=UPI001C92BFE4